MSYLHPSAGVRGTYHIAWLFLFKMGPKDQNAILLIVMAIMTFAADLCPQYLFCFKRFEPDGNWPAITFLSLVLLLPVVF